MLRRCDFFERGGIVLLHPRQVRAVFIGLVVLAFLVEGEEAVEQRHAAGGTQRDPVIGGDGIDRGALQLGAFHLAGHRAFPDQFVKPGLIGIEVTGDCIGQPVECGGADGFMRFLRILRLAGIGARHPRQVAFAIFGADHAAGIADTFGRHLHTIGSHVGDETGGFAADVHALIKLLRHLHRALGVEAQFAGGFLLQGRGDEGRRGVALDRFAFHLADVEILRLDQGDRACCIGFAAKRQLVELLAVQLGQARGEVALRHCHIGVDRPVFLGAESLDLQLAFTDQAQRHRLHPPG